MFAPTDYSQIGLVVTYPCHVSKTDGLSNHAVIRRVAIAVKKLLSPLQKKHDALTNQSNIFGITLKRFKLSTPGSKALGYKNLFPGWTLYKVTKPGFGFMFIFCYSIFVFTATSDFVALSLGFFSIRLSVNCVQNDLF